MSIRMCAALMGVSMMTAPAALAQSVGDPVIDTFVCTFVDGPVSVTYEANRAANEAGGRLLHTYSRIFNGFALRVSDKAIDRLVERNPMIMGCSQAVYVGLPDAGAAARGAPKPDNGGGKPDNGGGGKPGGGGGSDQTVPWGVARVGSGTPNGNAAWVVDTGVDVDNPDLNLVGSAEFLTAETFGGNANSVDDLNGHGTHVAGTIAAIDNTVGVVGVAPGAPVHSVRVLDSVGVAPDSDVAAGLDFVAANALPGDVVNLSLTADQGSTILDTGVQALAEGGVYVVMAAGNSGVNVDTSSVSPAYNNGSNLFTVSAIDKRSNLASFSNYGASVDYAEPGVRILSLAPGGGTTNKDGTSMAAPHLSGILLVTGGSVGADGQVKRDKDGIAEPVGVLP
ncbi:S8 family serine peptidase [Qipengyuania sp. 1NDH17]|uniref:S8 family serine peptidase n=1 Tax=Qipengyuania polymorpha TaxID=2867234 RepID=A0ABS7IYF0_9SPHN|nr:S8 family serine peptidase [Qipengyuania polymorpha]MBX7458584.1 S8 family serine peptidase [Qipengyuania polymorpha]